MLVYLNGRMVPGDKARVSPFDAGFLLGAGVFETMRARGGKVFRIQAHLERLDRGCRQLEIAPVPEPARLRAAVAATLRANGLTEARVRLTVTAGEEAPWGENAAFPTVVVTAFPLPARTVPSRAWTAGTCSRPVFSGDPLLGIKTTSRAGHYLARREARDGGYDEALLVNERGVYTEGSITNLFAVAGNVLVTPPVTDGLLPGVTREAVCALAAGLGFEVRERSLGRMELDTAAEVFLTNAVAGPVPVVALDGTAGGGGVPGPATGLLQEAYARLETSGD
ncbi:MAG: aminotransferase class IV [Candidatus Desulforudis sp.]|nr:aminotransferase class IV [Desulforudis sp.]